VAVTQRSRPVTSPGVPSRSVKQRLTEALSTFSTGCATSRATVADLCRRAGVSRNTLYRYYPEVAQAVSRLRRRSGEYRHRRQAETVLAMRSEVTELRTQVSQLATLADHYHTVAEELRALLARRDRELAALRGSRCPRLIRAPPARS
jgi:AcrR family transcriptional regulator